jgi:2-polyprenyl-6-methoxyphenol hydroxylase-like FAD-dependent oxidoreductase
MGRRSVLISGGGIAGATLAHWLLRFGFTPTVVEQAKGQRSSGNVVDIRGPALPIVRSMGLLPALRKLATRATGAEVVDASGARIAAMPGPNATRADGEDELEVTRADLASVLLRSCEGADIIFDESIAKLSQDAGGVNVRLASGIERRFDLLIGADGLHSVTRKLIFGNSEQFLRPLGMYVGTLACPELDPDTMAVQLYNAPGRLVAIHPGRDIPGAAFIFRHDEIRDLDHRDTQHHRQLIIKTYADDRWRVPELLDHIRDTDDLYFDVVSRVHFLRWSYGRVALAGDAASCVSLLGDGSTKAIAGAHTLAEELAGTDDHEVAFRRYQDRHKRLISSPASVWLASSFLVPATRYGIIVRNRLLRLIRH